MRPAVHAEGDMVSGPCWKDGCQGTCHYLDEQGNEKANEGAKLAEGMANSCWPSWPSWWGRLAAANICQ